MPSRIPASLISTTTCLSPSACRYASPARPTPPPSAASRTRSSPSSRRSSRTTSRVRLFYFSLTSWGVYIQCNHFINGGIGLWFSLAEFLPYVFQVMSLLLEIHSNSIPSSYMALFPHLLQPVLWERTGNIPPLVRLLQAFLEKGAASISSSAADKIVSDSMDLAAAGSFLLFPVV